MNKKKLQLKFLILNMPLTMDEETKPSFTKTSLVRMTDVLQSLHAALLITVEVKSSWEWIRREKRKVFKIQRQKQYVKYSFVI